MTLARSLDKFDFNSEGINFVYEENGYILLVNENRTVRAECKTYAHHHIRTDKARWDWIKDLMNKVEEQPIVLKFYPDIVNIIFQY